MIIINKLKVLYWMKKCSNLGRCRYSPEMLLAPVDDGYMGLIKYYKNLYLKGPQ